MFGCLSGGIWAAEQVRFTDTHVEATVRGLFVLACLSIPSFVLFFQHGSWFIQVFVVFPQTFPEVLLVLSQVWLKVDVQIKRYLEDLMDAMELIESDSSTVDT